MALDFGAMGSGLGALTSIGGGIFSAVTGSSDANAIYQQQRQMMMDEEQMNTVRRSAMELSARRQQMQNVRNAQYARSMALTTATGQGAAYGESSGLKGGYGSISGTSGQNYLGTNLNLQYGQQMFALEDQLTADKMELAKDQAGAAQDQAIGKLIGGIGGSMGNLFSFGSSLPGLFNSFKV